MDKSIQKEHKTAAAVEKANHNHEAAVQTEASAEKRLNVRTLSATCKDPGLTLPLFSSRDNISSVSSRSYRRDAPPLTSGSIVKMSMMYVRCCLRPHNLLTPLQ